MKVLIEPFIFCFGVGGRHGECIVEFLVDTRPTK